LSSRDDAKFDDGKFGDARNSRVGVGNKFNPNLAKSETKDSTAALIAQSRVRYRATSALSVSDVDESQRACVEVGGKAEKEVRH
jgi:hypothetical protein